MHHLRPGFPRAPASPGVHMGCVHLFQSTACGKGQVHRQSREQHSGAVVTGQQSTWEGSWGLPPELVGVGGVNCPLPTQHLSLLMASAEFAMKPVQIPWEGSVQRGPKKGRCSMHHPDQTTARLHWLCSNQACSSLQCFLGAGTFPRAAREPSLSQPTGADGSAHASTPG